MPSNASFVLLSLKKRGPFVLLDKVLWPRGHGGKLEVREQACTLRGRILLFLAKQVGIEQA